MCSRAHTVLWSTKEAYELRRIWNCPGPGLIRAAAFIRPLAAPPPTLLGAAIASPHPKHLRPSRIYQLFWRIIPDDMSTYA